MKRFPIAKSRCWYQFLHVLAHEIYEVSHLKERFDAAGHDGLSAAEVYNLIEPSPTMQNLHWHAWEYADSVIMGLRGEA
jgi:hypothetical protein